MKGNRGAHRGEVYILILFLLATVFLMTVLKVVGAQAEEIEPQATQSHTVTLKLEGGKINGLIAQGWSASTTDEYEWTYQAADGEEIILDDPYRTGCMFADWDVADESGSHTPVPSGEKITVSGDLIVTAQWDESKYTVTFADSASAGAQSWWTIQVPYGSRLWTEAEPDFGNQNLIWTPVTGADGVQSTTEATAEINFDTTGVPQDTVTVTRHQQDKTDPVTQNWQEYYYTFIKDDVYYFTYGGATPTKSGYTFEKWMCSDALMENGITADTLYTAQYEADDVYVFSIYYYNESGTRVEGMDPETITMYPDDFAADGTLVLEVPVKKVTHYTGILNESGLPAGTELVKDESGMDANGAIEDPFTGDKTYKVRVKRDEAFKDGSRYLALYTTYAPSPIDYTIEYYKQNVGAGTDKAQDYTKAGVIEAQASYESTVQIPDRPTTSDGYVPESGPDASFDGFLINDDSQNAVQWGVKLDASVTDAQADTAVIRIYYDRANYFVYRLTDSTETTLNPVKVQYGAPINLDEIQADASVVKKEGYALDEWKWYSQAADGSLQEHPVTQGDTMPSHDLYTIAQWTTAKTTVSIVYWIEDADSGVYMNEFTEQLTDIPTEAKIRYNLVDNELSASDKDNNPLNDVTMQIKNSVPEKFVSHMADEAEYFFYSEADVRTSQGNIESAEESGTGSVQSGQITGDSYEIIAAGDQSATINVYYKRNLYTLRFILTRKTSGNATQACTATANGIDSTSWVTLSDPFTFEEFTDGVDTKAAAGNETTYGTGSDAVTVEKVYTLSGASQTDTGAAIGRYGTWVNGSYTYQVYLLTARYGATISQLWPGAANIPDTYSVVGSSQGITKIKCVNMASQPGSLYRVENPSNSNILGAYAVMDKIIVRIGNADNSTAIKDNEGTGAEAHQLLAYWAKFSDVKEYSYYYLDEVLDPSVTKAQAAAFDPALANAGTYDDGDLVLYTYTNADGSDETRIYRYTTSYIIQRSSAEWDRQTAPTRTGFSSVGKSFDNTQQSGRYMYFFYNRESRTLRLYNISGNYIPPGGMLDQAFNLADGRTVTLKSLGWQEIGPDGTITVRYGADLTPLNDPAVIEYMTENGLSYSAQGGETRYFGRWYQDLKNTAEVDFTLANVSNASLNQVLYAGWRTPRHSVGYKLNGGSWSGTGDDAVSQTVMTEIIPESSDPNAGDVRVYLYYNHYESDGNADVYWYRQTKDDDRQYVDQLYRAKLSDIMEQTSGLVYWHLKSGQTLEELQGKSELQSFTEDERLLDVYLCFLQYVNGAIDTSLNHEHYVSVNKYKGELLTEPPDPVRNGYKFAGWWHFDSLDGVDTSRKVYLTDVLSERESITSFGEEYVWISSAGDAHILYEDAAGLFYYPSQTGYRFLYSNGASIIDRDRELYAAWESLPDAQTKVMHLIPVDEAGTITSFTKADGNQVIIDKSETIRINNSTDDPNGATEYYIVEDGALNSGLYSGSVQEYHAESYYQDDGGKKWLPLVAQIDLNLSDQTPEAAVEVNTGGEDVYVYTGGANRGQSYRVKNVDNTYTYYAWFVYEKSEQLEYTVYAIDIQRAVTEGALADYKDRFDRANPPKQDAAYVISATPKSTAGTTVTETAPTISGYGVYDQWEQQFRLESAPATNNIYFYYVNDGKLVSCDITYYLMTGGKYSESNTVRLEGIPAVIGESLNKGEISDRYEDYISTAWQAASIVPGGNQALADMKDRYKNMVVSVQADGVDGSFEVATGQPVQGSGSVGQDVAGAMLKDYMVDSWSLSGDTVMLTGDIEISIYLRDAQIVLNKVDSAGKPLKGAEFSIEKYLPVPSGSAPDQYQDVIVYDGRQYYKDTAFSNLSYIGKTAATDSAGQAVFYDLSTDVSAGAVYRISETKAPAGQVPVAEPFFVPVPYQMGSDIHYTVTYDITNPGITYLPKAGVFGGVYIPLLVGGGLLSAAVIVYSQFGLCRRQPTKSSKKKMRSGGNK